METSFEKELYDTFIFLTQKKLREAGYVDDLGIGTEHEHAVGVFFCEFLQNVPIKEVFSLLDSAAEDLALSAMKDIDDSYL